MPFFKKVFAIGQEIGFRFRDRWWDKANLVATDYFLSNDLVDVAKEVEKKKKRDFFC